MDLFLKDKVALVTGGNRGLGKTLCTMLAAEGAKVAVCDLEDATATAAEIAAKHGVPTLAVKCDVTSESDVAAAFGRVGAELGPVELLVNNAAIAPLKGKSVVDIGEGEFARTFQVNVTGTFLCSRELVRRLRAAGRGGRIVNISSQAALRGSESGKLAYDSSKGAIISFTIALARELAPQGIAVNCVLPGLMRTEMLAPFIDADPERFNKRSPMGRIGTTQEIAAVAVFLCSERAGYMTGASVDVSGGLAMH